MIVVFPHVPKCGGTSIAGQLRASGLDLILDYDDRPSGDTVRQARCEERNARARTEILPPNTLVYGHFPAARYRHLPHRLVAMLRHPVDRAFSHYCYYRDLVPEQNVQHSFEPALIRGVRSGRIGFVEFCSSPLIRGLYTNFYFPGLARRDFEYVGFFDDYSRSISDIGDLLGVRLSADVWERRNDDKGVLDEATARSAAAVLATEIDFYESMR